MSIALENGRARRFFFLNGGLCTYLYTSLAARSGSGRNRSILGKGTFRLLILLFLLPSDNVRQDLQHGSLLPITFPKEENLGKQKETDARSLPPFLLTQTKKKIGGCYGRNVDVFFFWRTYIFLSDGGGSLTQTRRTCNCFSAIIPGVPGIL